MSLSTLEGHDPSKKAFNIDALAIAYIGLAVALNASKFLGLWYLALHRRDTYVRMLNLGLMTLSYTMLSIYTTLAILGYSLQAYYPCSIEYHMMATFFPTGQLLADIVQAQLLEVILKQTKLLRENPFEEAEDSTTHIRLREPPHFLRMFKDVWNEASHVLKLITTLIIAAKASMFLSIALWFLSRRFKPFGVFGKLVSDAQCRQGGEWFPGILMNLFTTYLYNPYLIWNLRGNLDLHNYRLIAILTLVLQLPGPALWLAALYDSTGAFKAPDNFWIAPLYFAVGIEARMLITIGNAVIQIRRRRNIREATINLLAELHVDGNGIPRINTHSRRKASALKTAYTLQNLQDRLLRKPLGRLLGFAANKDMTAENFLFLQQAYLFQGEFNFRKSRTPGLLNPSETYVLYGKAVEIYARFFAASTAVVPLNVPPRIKLALDALFRTAAKRRFSADINLAVDFDWTDPKGIEDGFNYYLEYALQEAAGRRFVSKIPLPTALEVRGTDGIRRLHARCPVPCRIPPGLDVPNAFDEDVFNNSIEYVLRTALSLTFSRYVDWELQERPHVEAPQGNPVTNREDTEPIPLQILSPSDATRYDGQVDRKSLS